jgi:hypothetical protein
VSLLNALELARRDHARELERRRQVRRDSKLGGLTLDEVLEIATRLRVIHHELVSLHVRVSNAFAKSHGRRWRNAVDKTLNALLSARLRLEDLACEQHGHEAGMVAANPRSPLVIP